MERYCQVNQVILVKNLVDSEPERKQFLDAVMSIVRSVELQSYVELDSVC